MQSFCEMSISFENLLHDDVKAIFKKFCESHSDWRYPDDKSAEYEQFSGEPAFFCVLLDAQKNDYASVAFAASSGNTFKKTNIVPIQDSQLSMEGYNSTVDKLVKEFREYNTENKITIKYSKGRYNLKDIITGDMSRTIFERYLGLWPTSYHPNDIERLDRFIVFAHSHLKKPLDLGLLRRFLIEDKQWDPKDAEWCVSRIQTGFDILKLK